MTRVGVLALQGDFAEHAAMLRGLGIDAPEIRLPADLDHIDGLILPGGESTTIGKLLVMYGLLDPIAERARHGFPIWGTCAGLILLAKRISGSDLPHIGVLDITVERNAFGRQRESFEADLAISGLDRPFPAVFIRAPVIAEVGPVARAVATLPDGRVVGVRQGGLLGTAFHPELTADSRLHEQFVDLVRQGH